jgi:hypothetical protein
MAFLIVLLLPLLNSTAHALSPSFSNQQLDDEAFNWIDINKKASTSSGDPSIDIRGVDYASWHTI